MSMRDRIAQAIRAYHGSPHSFDKFDASKIGTGEGAQSYGRGLYFAGNEDVARSYRDTLAPALGKLPDDVISMPQESRASFMRQVATDRDPMAAAKYAQYGATALRQEDVNKLADLIAQTRQARQGHMYEVNINAKPEQLLDWDKPLRAQPEGVQALARDAPRLAGNDVVGGQLSEPTGQAVYQRLRTMKGDAASKVLQGYDVPGISYLDQGSRNLDSKRADLTRDIAWARANLKQNADVIPGLEQQLAAMQPTSNYVVFDPGIVDIMRKYGVAGAAPVGMGALAAQDQYGGAQ